MYEDLRSATVHAPSTITEYASIVSRFPDAQNWAGGTYLMSRPGFYPNEGSLDIIDLSGISELQKITRTDRFVEIGAMVNAAQMLDAGRLILPAVLLDALKSIGSSIVRRQVTIGGSLCIPDVRLSLSTALSVLDSLAEVKVYQKDGKCTTRWIPVYRLYDKEGKLLNFEGKMLITRIRIGLEYGNFQRFMQASDPVRNMEEAVILAFQADRTPNALGKVRLCITCPHKVFFISKEIISQLSGITLPIVPKMVRYITSNLRSELKKSYTNISDLQLERALRMFESILHELDTIYLQS
ncbi:MAG: FAD binding domain-containing protein [Sphaerochaetaceae bacterium]